MTEPLLRNKPQHSGKENLPLIAYQQCFLCYGGMCIGKTNNFLRCCTHKVFRMDYLKEACGALTKVLLRTYIHTC